MDTPHTRAHTHTHTRTHTPVRTHTWQVGELIGGSQREDRYDVLMARIKEGGMDAGPYEQYLDTRKWVLVAWEGGGCFCRAGLSC